MKTICHLVSDVRSASGKKVGEEVRLCDEHGSIVKTLNLTDPEQFGTYVSGQEYEIEGPTETATPPVE